MNKFEETRNREIKDAFKAFAEHQATLKQYGELEILDIPFFEILFWFRRLAK